MAYIQGSTPSNPHVLTRPECRWSLVSIMKIQVKQSHVKNALCMHAKLLQSCSTLCDPVEHSLPGSSLHGTIQARILEWVAMPSSRGSSWPRDQPRDSCGSCISGRFFTIKPPGKPKEHTAMYKMSHQLAYCRELYPTFCNYLYGKR